MLYPETGIKNHSGSLILKQSRNSSVGCMCKSPSVYISAAADFLKARKDSTEIDVVSAMDDRSRSAKAGECSE